MIDEIVSHFTYDPNTGFLYGKYGKKLGYVESTGYIRVQFQKKGYQAHRIAWVLMTGEWPDGGIDHINRDKTDNRWENLRLISHADNCINGPLRANNSSGITGVRWEPSRSKWVVTFRTSYHGVYGELFEACCKRKSLEASEGVIFV